MDLSASQILTSSVWPLGVMGVLGLAFGALLAFASIAFYVKTDERVAKIREVLPGANCGGCGYPGCDGYAAGIVSEGAELNKCAAGGAAAAEKIAAIMGVASTAARPMRAFLKCNGTMNDSPRSNVDYSGVRDCREAVIIPGTSPHACPFGCIGLGTCTKVCQFGAITTKHDLAVVDPEKCVGCGACVDICPKGVLTLIPKDANEMVVCSSKWKGPNVKRVCSVGCIGCGLCAKNCHNEAITLVGGSIAVIDPLKCDGCGVCQEKCPVHIIQKPA